MAKCKKKDAACELVTFLLFAHNIHSVYPSSYFLTWPIHPAACGGGGILGSYVKE